EDAGALIGVRCVPRREIAEDVDRLVEAEPALSHAHIAALPNDQVVEHVHVEQLAGRNDLARDQHVFRAGGRVAWSRDRARCTPLDVYVSPSPSPNRTCTFPRIRLSIRLPYPRGGRCFWAFIARHIRPRSSFVRPCLST